MQIATDDQVAIIDPQTCGKLDGLAALLADENIMKLFHAGSQDIEILLRETGTTPWPLFDTQIAAALLGHSYQVGFASLVQSFCGVRLKKQDSFTDWSRRPLTESQLSYAADDVVYLPELYETMRAMLEEKDRLDWLDDDFKSLADETRYFEDPMLRFKRLKRVHQLSGQQLAAAREVAAWRERIAMSRDIPRKWVIGDEEIVEACKREAMTLDELFMVRGIKQHVSTRDAREIIANIKRGLSVPRDEWPKLPGPQPNEPNVDVAVDLMESLLRFRAKQNGIALQTLASHDDMQLIARGHMEDSALMHGWRKELVGDEIIDLISGKISLRLNGTDLDISAC